MLTYAQTSQIESLPDANNVGQLQNFCTNNPAYERLNADTLNVYTASEIFKTDIKLMIMLIIPKQLNLKSPKKHVLICV